MFHVFSAVVISLGNSTLLFWKIGTIHFFSERLDVKPKFLRDVLHSESVLISGHSCF